MRDDGETDQSIIEETLEEKGAIVRCPVHDLLTDNLDQGAKEEAIEELGEVYGVDTATEMVERVLSDIPIECPDCPSDDD